MNEDNELLGGGSEEEKECGRREEVEINVGNEDSELSIGDREEETEDGRSAEGLKMAAMNILKMRRD